MDPRIEYFFDVVSPASYLAWTQLPALAAQTGATIEYRPMFLPGLFKEAGSSSPISVAAKGKWMFADLSRFARKYDVPFRLNDKFPMNSIAMMRGLIAWRDREEFFAMAGRFFDAVWVSNRNVTDPAELRLIVEEAGVDPREFEEQIADPAVKQSLIESTAEAARRGAFGAPTFFVAGEMYWGQDRLEFVRDAALRQAGG
jgi:2-hydroxychromene-2-carboxylate isomerase